MNIATLIERTRKAGEVFESPELIQIANECERMREAMQEFVDRCDRGEVLSSYTRGKFEKILAGESTPPPIIDVTDPDREWHRQ